MKKIYLTLLSLALIFSPVVINAAAAPASEGTPVVEETLSAKEQAKLEKKMAKFEKKMEKKAVKGKKGWSDINKNFRLAILLGGGALILSIIAGAIVSTSLTGFGLAGILWLLASLAWLAALVFLVIGIIEVAS